MNPKLNEIDLSQTGLQTSSNFSINNSLLFPTSSVKASAHNSRSPKMFQRKPSFKAFQRKEKKQPDQNNRITYISPQKSDLFKKYPCYSQNRTDLNSSMFTDNSSDIFGKQQTKRSFKPLSLFLDLNQSRSVLNEINNLKVDNGFMTPKNTKNQTNWTSPSNLKKSSVKKLKNQVLTVANQETDFSNDFNSLHQIKQPNFGLFTASKNSYCESERRILKNSSKQLKQNYSREKSFQNLPIESRIKISNNEIEIEQLKGQCNKLRIQKNQMEDSSRIFLEQIKSLQLKIQIENQQKTKAFEQLTALKSMLSEKQKQILNLNIQIKNLEALNQQNKSTERDQNEHLKAMYFQLSQKLKYLNVENGILKKMLEQKKEDGFKIQKLQNLNKKLTSKNKFLTKALQEIEAEDKDSKLESVKSKQYLQLNMHSNRFTISKSIRSQTNFKTPNKRPVSKVFDSGLNLSPVGLSKVPQEAQAGDTLSILSNNSSLELSFELSPQKNKWPKFNEESCIRQFKTTNAIK